MDENQREAAARLNGQDYDYNYVATRGEAEDFSIVELVSTMEDMLSFPNKTEGTWGCLDALADLLFPHVFVIMRSINPATRL